MKMKKLILAAAGASLMMFGQAQAAENAATKVGGSITNQVATGCSLLTANVKISLSENVAAAYYCDTNDNSEAYGMMFFGTCHKSGSYADRSYTCTAADASAGTNGCATDGEQLTITGRAAFLGSSDGGVINGKILGSNTCDVTDATAIKARVSEHRDEYIAALQ